MKLWIYGCSFSLPFGLTPDADCWGKILAYKLQAEYINRSMNGIGWNYITHQIEQDVSQWSQSDLIIISPSFLERFTCLEYKDIGVPPYTPETCHLYKTLDEIYDLNELRWRSTIINYQKLGFNVYTWLVNDPKNGPVMNMLSTPNNKINWKSWMDEHHEYWTSLPGEKYPLGDWHFNPTGHIAVAERMHLLLSS